MGFLYSQFFVTPSYPNASFAGQTIIVTGSNVGLGKEAARHFARLGASKLILAVRNIKAGEVAKKDIEETTKCGHDVIEVWHLDLSSYATVKAFADRASKLPRLDILLENAAIAVANGFVLAEQHEWSLTINVISTFLLALLLLPKLKSSAKAFGIKPRLVIVSSEVHSWAKFPEWKEPKPIAALNDPMNPRMSERYPTTKLLEVLVVRKMAPMLEGTGVIINMLNPGLCHSELARDSGWGLAILKFFLARSTEVGSRTLVASAAAGPESHGKYMSDGVLNEGEVSRFVKSEDGKKAAEKVWTELKDILKGICPGVTKNI